MLGPIDYVVLGFQGNNFDGSIMAELAKAVENGTIRVIDLVFIIKDKDGNVVGGEFEDQSDDLKNAMSGLKLSNDMPLFTESDIEKVAVDIPNDTAAGVLVIEHLWAVGLKEAIGKANGFLIADGRIHPDAVEAALADLEAEKSKA